MTTTYLKDPEKFKGLAIVWPLIGEIDELSSSNKWHYTPIIQFSVDHLVEQAESAKKIKYKITLDSPIQKIDNEWNNSYSDSINELEVDGILCLLFEGTP